MSLLKTMIKHTAGGQEASAGCETPSLPPQQPQPAIYVSTGLDVHEVEDARDWPEDREIDGTLCRRLSPEYFAGYVPACSRPKPRTRPESSPRMPGTRCGSDSTPCRRWPSGSSARNSCRRITALFFPEELSTTALRPRPGRNPSKFPERTGFIPGTKLGNVSSR